MSTSLFHSIQRIVHDEVVRVRTAELAIVEEQHPHASGGDNDNYSCTVRLRNSGIVLKRVPIVTSRIGTVSVPSVGDMVLVQFVDGDLNSPIIVGCLYNDEDRPPINADSQSITHLPLDAADSDAVHIELNSGDKRELLMKFGNGLDLRIRDDDPVIELDVAGGQGKIRIERDGAMTIESAGTLSIKASEIKIEASGQLTLKGATVNIN